MTRRSIIAALAALALGSCRATNHGSVEITQLCFPPTPEGGSCGFDAGECSAVLANGRLAVDLTTRTAAADGGATLEYPLQLDNFREDPTDVDGRTNSNTARIERFDMRYEAQGFSLGSASSRHTAEVPTNGSTVVVVNLIPSSVGAAMAAALPAGPTEVVIKVKAHGRYLDDTEFDSSEYLIPVSVQQLGGYVYGCPAGKTLTGVCPQQGQTAVAGCE